MFIISHFSQYVIVNLTPWTIKTKMLLITTVISRKEAISFFQHECKRLVFDSFYWKVEETFQIISMQTKSNISSIYTYLQMHAHLWCAVQKVKNSISGGRGGRVGAGGERRRARWWVQAETRHALEIGNVTIWRMEAACLMAMDWGLAAPNSDEPSAFGLPCSDI